MKTVGRVQVSHESSGRVDVRHEVLDKAPRGKFTPVSQGAMNVTDALSPQGGIPGFLPSNRDSLPDPPENLTGGRRVQRVMPSFLTELQC